MLVSTVITHNGGAVLRTRIQTASSSVQRSNSRGHTQHFHHRVAVAVGSYTTAVRLCDCDMHDHRARVALVRSTDCQRPPPPPTTHAQRYTALPLQRGGNARAHATQRRGTHKHEKSTTNNPTQRCAVTQQPQRDAVQQRRRDNTNPPSQYCGTAPSP